MVPIKVLLKEIQALNNEERYQEVIDKLPDDLLESYENADLYAEKALASYRFGHYDLCDKVTSKALLINPLHAKANHYKGNLLCDQAQKEKAIEHYTKALEAEPDFELPYNGLGYTCLESKEHNKAMEWFNKALEINPKNIESIIGVGDVYAALSKNDKALEYYHKAIKLASQSSYAYAYNSLGDFYLEKKQYKEAIDNYNNAIKFDPKFVDAYINIGVAYHNQEEYQKSIEYYNQALTIRPKYILAYNGLGACYLALEQNNKAGDFLNKVLEIEPHDSTAVYNRALLHFETKQFKKALGDYELYVELTKDDPDFYTEKAKSSIEELRKILDNDTYNIISNLLDKIKKLLLFTDNCISHYTSLSVTKALILDDSPFRLSEGAFLNDTSEGRELFNYLSFQATSTNGNEILATPFAPKPFIGSFVAENKHDDLTLWRMYGKEAKDEARGCAITINKNALLKSLQNKLLPDNKSNSQLKADAEFNFYRVAYKKQDTDFFIIPGAQKEEKKLNGYMQDLRHQVNNFLEQEKDNISNTQSLLELLNDIAYLFKSAEYQYEHEVRLVIRGIGFEKFILKDSIPPRVYIELVPINSVLTEITLGPKVERADEWASAFYYSLDKKDYKPNLLISHLPFK